MRNIFYPLNFIVVLAFSLVLGSCDNKRSLSPFSSIDNEPLSDNFICTLLRAQCDSTIDEKYRPRASGKFTLMFDSSTVLLSNKVRVFLDVNMERNLIVLSRGEVSIGDSIYKRLDKGLNTLIACEFGELKTPTDYYAVAGNSFFVDSFVAQLNAGEFPTSSITVEGSSITYKAPSILCTRHFQADIDEYLSRTLEPYGYTCKILAYADGKPIALAIRKESNGAVLTLVSTPLLFSNFGISYNQWAMAPVVSQLLRMSGFYSAEKGKTDRLLPISYVCCTEYSWSDVYEGKYKNKPQLPVSYENERPTSSSDSIWSDFFGGLAKKVLLILVAVFSVFVIRRRQHAIPLFDGYRNRTADYVRQVGVLYMAEGKLNVVLKNKIVFFFSEVFDRLHIQLNDKEKISQHAVILADAVGCPELNLEGFLNKLNLVLDENTKVDNSMLARMSDEMNLIAGALRGDLVRDQLLNLFKEKNIKD
ncbi:MAG: hypothetical protein II623_12880 [Paludibacteraceae bacterium]|nr:hypothetical protein [Paludibacteraceae bacterium]